MTDIDIAAPITVNITARGITRGGTAQLRLFFESGVDEGAFYPASDIQIYGTKGVYALRDFCNQVIEATKVNETKNL